MKEPLISIVLDNRSRPFEPGETLSGEYQIDAVDPRELRAVELSVLWSTEGKGDEDLGVHSFEGVSNQDPNQAPLNEWRRFAVRLPQSPLSYEGVLVKIRWCVRVRAFLRGGRNCLGERSFQLGGVPRAKALPAASGRFPGDIPPAGREPTSPSRPDE